MDIFDYKMYAVRDVKTGFLSPFCEVNDACARRSFSRAVGDSSSMMNSHPEDFSLYRIGSYYPDTGSVDDILPVLICQASDFKKE